MIHLPALSARIGDSVTFAILNAIGLRHGGRATSRDLLHAWIESHHGQPRDTFFSGHGDFTLQKDHPRHLVWQSRRPSGYPENDRARADLYLTTQGWQAPTVLLLHALMSASDIGYRLWAAKFNQLGWNACFVHLPYHYSRRPARCWNGELAITCDIIRTGEALRQAVVDLRDLMALLQSRGSTRFGLWATSYGGWIGGLLISVESAFQFVVLMEPIVDVDHAVWTSPAGAALRFHLRRQGVSREDYAACLGWFSPRHAQPLLPGNHIYLVGGTHDRVAEADDIRAVAHQWHARYLEFDQGHIGYSMMPGTFNRLQADGLLTP